MSRLEVRLTPRVNYSYAYSFGFENTFDPGWSTNWVLNNWHTSLYVITVYLGVIFGVRSWMSGRSRLDLRTVLTLWNLGMAIFSTLGAARTVPELYYVLKTFGFRYSICNASFILLDRVSGFWAYLFNISKVIELFDTLFIVLRKQRLIFLHWYHHATVLILTWYFFASLTALGRWFICMNYFVHSLMYTYFALRSLKIRLPLVVSMVVTGVQIVQTIFGLFVILYSWLLLLKKEECGVGKDVVILALFLYGTNFVLFVRLFYESYLSPRRDAQRKLK